MTIRLALFYFCLLLPALFAGDKVYGQPAETTSEPGGEQADSDFPLSEPAEQGDADSLPVPVPLDGELPWKKPATGPVIGGPPVAIDSARDLLEQFSIDQSQLDNLLNGLPLEEKHETLVKVLFRLPQIGLDKVAGWVKKKTDWEALAADPAQFRAEFFSIAGQVTQVEKVRLAAQTAEVFDFSSYYRVSLTAPGTAMPVQIVCRFVPKDWKLNESVDYPAQADGLFLHAGPPEQNGPLLTFAAVRMHWLPGKANAELKVTPDEVFLAGRGVDIGQLREVKHRSREIEREPFYETLSAVSSLPPETLAKRAEPFDLGAALQAPASIQGRAVEVEGYARRITKIQLGKQEADIKQRFGIDHYYQVDVFVSLGDKTIRFGNDPQDPAAVEFSNSYPIHVCVLKLPAGLEPAESMSKKVKVSGVFFKLWAYRSDYVSAVDENKRQIGPMVIGSTPELIVSRLPQSSGYWGLGIGLTFTAILLGLWFCLWRYKKSDKAFEQQTLNRQFEVPANKSLNDLGIEAPTGPDFSGLEGEED